jgi:hypothetical protein
LAAQVFLLFGNTKSAENILSFYDVRAARENGAFVNAYDATRGQAFESVIHVGPNVWIGIAALQYEHKVKDGRFLPLAQRVADWVISQQDAEGGLKGGPTVTLIPRTASAIRGKIVPQRVVKAMPRKSRLFTKKLDSRESIPSSSR